MSVLIAFTMAAILVAAQDAAPAVASATETTAPTADAAPPATASLTIEAPIAELADNPAAREIVTRHLPNLFAHPAYDAFKGFSLRALQPHSNGAITDAAIASIEAELSALR